MGGNQGHLASVQQEAAQEAGGPGFSLTGHPQSTQEGPAGLDPGAMPESHPQGETLSWDNDEETAVP